LPAPPPLDEYNKKPVVEASKKIWFVNGDLVRILSITRSTGICHLWNMTREREEVCFFADFKKNRKRAYTVTRTAKLVNRHPKHLPRLATEGVIPWPMGALPNGERAFQSLSYYSEDAVREIRDILATISHGRPNRYGTISNNVTPTVQELNRRMGDGILTYTMSSDGNFIPVWTETL
jgi:hypothetical protein